MTILVWSIVIGSLLATAPVNLAQTGAPTPEVILGTCEDNVSYLSNAHHLAGSDGTIIAIARLGDNESNPERNRRRLHNVRVYLTEFGWQRAPSTVITAQGEPTKGYGRVELYVRGVLFAFLQVRRNQDLLVGSCEPDDIRPVNAEKNLYPFLDQRRRKPNARR